MKNIDKNSIILFFSLWILVSAVLFFSLYITGFVPGYIKAFVSNIFGEPEKPVPVFSKDSARLIIPKISVDSQIIFPTSTDMKILDKALYSGAVHYPESALPGENGNVFIFGHSTSRAFVKNQAFTVFTKLSELQKNDLIRIHSNGVDYNYRVVSVQILNPNEAKVYLKTPKSILTLSTCWPVGSPTNRTVVEAEFLERSLVPSVD